MECHWGDMKSIRQIFQQLEACYNTIVTWKINFFLVPRGSSGKSLISEAARIINLYNNNTIMKSIAPKC